MNVSHPGAIYDASGRYLAPAPIVLPERPVGPWSTNHAATGGAR
jgi:hypothetical protein